jgi:aspartate ammonia-lyase
LASPKYLYLAYYGIQTHRAIENYRISGILAHPRLICAMGMIEKGAARANLESKPTDANRSNATQRTAQEVIKGKWNGEVVVDVYQAGAAVSFHANASEVIANRAIELLGGKRGDYALCDSNDLENCSQSTNDVSPNAMRLACLFLFDEVLRAVAELAK